MSNAPLGVLPDTGRSPAPAAGDQAIDVRHLTKLYRRNVPLRYWLARGLGFESAALASDDFSDPNCVAALRDISFSVGRREDVDAIASAMSAAGVTPLFPAREYPEFAPGFYAVTFCDPDNNVIEFGHAPAVPGATRTPAK